MRGTPAASFAKLCLNQASEAVISILAVAEDDLSITS